MSSKVSKIVDATLRTTTVRLAFNFRFKGAPALRQEHHSVESSRA